MALQKLPTYAQYPLGISVSTLIYIHKTVSAMLQRRSFLCAYVSNKLIITSKREAKKVGQNLAHFVEMLYFCARVSPIRPARFKSPRA